MYDVFYFFLLIIKNQPENENTLIENLLVVAEPRGDPVPDLHSDNQVSAGNCFATDYSDQHCNI